MARPWIPLIKFKGPRSLQKTQTVALDQGILTQVPLRFKPSPLSLKEMEAVQKIFFMTEPLIILQEKGLKDAFDKKCKISDNRYTCMTCESDLVLSTTASVGLQLIKWDNQLPIGCLSTPSNVTWHCPAVYLDNAFIAIPKNKELSIFKWNLGDKFIAPVKKMTLDNCPYRIWNFLNSGVLIGYNNGKVEVMDGEFKVLLDIDPVIEYQEVLFMDCIISSKDLKLLIVGVSKDKQELHLSLASFEKGESLPVLASRVSFDVDGFKGLKELGFSFDGKHLAILDETFKVSTFNIRSNSIDKVSHDLSFKLKESKPLCLKLISYNHVAVLCATKIGTKVVPQVLIWDNRYGTLQSVKDIDMITLPDKLNRSQGYLNGFYDASGYFLTVSLSHLSSSIVNTAHLLLPINLEPISLKSVLGKLANTCEASSPIATLQFDLLPSLSQASTELNILNQNMLTKLLEQKTSDKFEMVFKEWVCSNLDLFSKQTEVSKMDQEKNWVEKPAFVVSQNQLKEIATACYDDEVGLWPRSVIKYCLRNRLFYSSMIKSSLVKNIVGKADAELLWLAIHNLLDISENEWTFIVRYILGVENTVEFDQLASCNVNIEKQKSEAGSLSCGQDYICALAFSAPRNHHLMVRALTSLDVTEMEKLLQWVFQIISMKDERFMWWIWGSIGTDLPQEKLDILFKRRKIAIDTLSLLVDSNVVLFSTSPKLLELLQEIRTHINRECNFASNFQMRIFGMLKQFKKETLAPIYQNKSAGGRRWKRMVQDLHDNTGSYCVEVLKL